MRGVKQLLMTFATVWSRAPRVSTSFCCCFSAAMFCLYRIITVLIFHNLFLDNSLMSYQGNLMSLSHDKINLRPGLRPRKIGLSPRPPI